MPSIIALTEQTTVFAAPQYPGSNDEAAAMGLSGNRNKEMRAMTIAAFRLAQNNSQLSTRVMNAELLHHLVAGSDTALAHWKGKGRLALTLCGYSLTPSGLAECQNTLLGLAGAYSTNEAKVQEWVIRMINGDQVAQNPRTFPRSAWPQ